MQRSKSFVQNLQMMSRPSITPSLWQISNSMAGLDVLHHPHCRSELMPSSRSCAWQEIKLQPQHFRWRTKTQETRSKSSRIQTGMSCAHHRSDVLCAPPQTAEGYCCNSLLQNSAPLHSAPQPISLGDCNAWNAAHVFEQLHPPDYRV